TLANAAVKAMLWAKIKFFAATAAVAALVVTPAVILLRPSSGATLVSHYKFNESSGTRVADAGSGPNHGTLVGGVSRVAGPRTGMPALNFDGKTGYVQLEKDLTQWIGGTASVACWMRTTLTSPNDSSNPAVAGVQRSNNDDIGWGVIDPAGRV